MIVWLSQTQTPDQAVDRQDHRESHQKYSKPNHHQKNRFQNHGQILSRVINSHLIVPANIEESFRQASRLLGRRKNVTNGKRKNPGNLGVRRKAFSKRKSFLDISSKVRIKPAV